MVNEDLEGKVAGFIQQAIISIPFISQILAKYENAPAVFYQMIPSDNDALWENEIRYPRICYTIDWVLDLERKTDGQMTVAIYGLNEQSVSPAEITAKLLNGLRDLLFTDESGTFSLLANGKDCFAASDKEPLVIGATLSFDIIAFKKQSEIAPSPVWGINQFLKQVQSNCKIIGLDIIPEIYKITCQEPVIYAELTETVNKRTSFAMAWQGATIQIHVLSPVDFKSHSLVQMLLVELSLERQFTMQNGSPFLIMSINHNNNVNPICDGQIVITGEYGILRKPKPETKMENVYFRKE